VRRRAGYDRSIVRRLCPVLLPALALLVAAQATAAPSETGSSQVEVIVELAAPPAGAASPAARSAALRRIETVERGVVARIAALSPGADVRWRYRLVLPGLAVVLPARDVRRISSLPGVAAVYPSVRYRPLASSGGPDLIGAPAIWGPGLEHGGRGLKIGIIDDGIDPSHAYFDPAGFQMPEGFPKGDVSFTTAKIIVARAFPPPGADWRYAARPFDRVNSSHGTHVAGIAAGDAGTIAEQRPRTVISGVAPLAYLGNYKALTVPTASGLGLNGNSPEIVAAIEAAVADGMDVINLSLGEPEIDPARDAVATALDNAAAAGVVPVVAAGNDFLELGRGSVSSPGTAPRAITVAAVDGSGEIASFSGSGPTPLGLEPKPDVAAPGVDVLSSVPGDEFEELSGTSMAAPQVAGAAALLLELHPDWSVEQVKSALVLTARPVSRPTGEGEVPSSRQGGGLVDLARATDPVVNASPQSFGFGLIDVSSGDAAATASVALSPVGPGQGPWSVQIEQLAPAAGITMSVPASIDVPGELEVALVVAAGAAEGDRAGFVVLEREGQLRRIPFWFRVARPRLSGEPFRTLERQGTYSGSTAGRAALVSAYRYPDAPRAVTGLLAGPEQVFRLELRAPAANLGVAVLGTAKGVQVQPRILLDANENRMTGATSLPYVANPYLARFLAPTRSAAALLPQPGTYAIVFDGPSRRSAGRFRFRLWIDDVTPPAVTLTSRVARDGRLLARVSDRGSGVDPNGISYRIDRRAEREGRLRGGTAILQLPALRPGVHRLALRVSDRQEAKNNENVARILPNTRVLVATFRVPPPV
jgi:subtilisin family serine protease